VTRRRVGAALAVALLLGVGSARGQASSVPAPASASGSEAEADAFFRAGSAAFAQGDHRAAAQSFEEAYRRVPRGASIYNAAAAWDSAGEHGRALEGFEIALGRDDLEEALRRAAQSRVDALHRSLGCLSIHGPEGWTVSVAHAEGRALPTKVCVAPGEHSARLEGPGGDRVTRSARVEAGRTVEIAPDVPRPKANSRASPPVVPTAPAKAEQAPTGSRRAWGLIAVGGSAVLAGTAAYLGVRTLDTLDEFDSNRHSTDLHDRTIAFRAWTNIAWVGAAVLGGVGVALLLTAPSRSASKPAPRATVRLGPLGASARF